MLSNDIHSIKKGQWYMLDYYGNRSGIKAKAIKEYDDYVTMKFYWGFPIRTLQRVKKKRVVEICSKPKLFSNY